MTKWKLIQGSMIEEPKMLDMTSSPTTVYERRNIKKVVVNDNEKETAIWMYEERQTPIEEYEALQNALETPMAQLVMQAISRLELSIEMQEVE